MKSGALGLLTKRGEAVLCPPQVQPGRCGTEAAAHIWFAHDGRRGPSEIAMEIFNIELLSPSKLLFSLTGFIISRHYYTFVCARYFYINVICFLPWGSVQDFF